MKTANILFSGLLLFPLAESAAAEKPAKPNIVVILSDDMNWDLPGFNGGPVLTPHLDRLVREGANLKQFYVHAVCSPTRAAFLTGRYPFRNGMEERSHGNDTAGMLPDERTLAEALKEVGYDTALIGKWHLGNWFQRQLPLQRGFDHHYGLYGALISYTNKVRERYYDWHRNGETIREDGYSTDLFAREFEQWIDARKGNRGRPFFAYVPFNAIHGPLEAPPELVTKYRRLLKDTPAKGTPPNRDPVVKAAMLDSMDAAIGRILASLKTAGVADNTLVVFFNDNGGPRTNPPFRGGKGDTYEGGVRVPCVFHWPGRVPAGRTIEGMMHVVDLYPTLLNLAGGSLTQPLPLDGIDMWQTITAGKASPRTEVVHSLPGEHVETGEMAIRQGEWKLVGEELYNLDKDPAETTDLAAQHPEIYQRLHARIQNLVTERRPAEEHLKVPDKPLLVFGEKENANPPPWLQPYLDALPESKKESAKANGKTKKRTNK